MHDLFVIATFVFFLSLCVFVLICREQATNIIYITIHSKHIEHDSMVASHYYNKCPMLEMGRCIENINTKKTL